MLLLNVYSFAIFSIVIFSLIAYLILRRGINARSLILTGLLAVTILGVWFVLRPQPGTQANRDAIISQIGQGIPVLVEIQSPY